MKLSTVFFFLALALVHPADADLRLSRLIGEGMVLQRDVPVAIWGWAEEGTEVTVTFDGQAHAARTGADGRWTVTLPARGAGGPYRMTIDGGGESFEIGDVLVGDVWLCSGQSNMEFPVSRALDFPAEAAAATDRKIRHFQVPKSSAGRPEEELAGGEWVVTSPETVGDFTAVGYFFARELRRHVDVPIGLLHSSWGGSRIEPWMSAEALGLGDDEEDAYQVVERQMKEESARRLADLRKKIGDVPDEDQGMDGDRPVWADPALDDSGWERMSLPGRWEELGYPGLDGVVWFRRTLSLTAEEAAAATEIGLGKIDDGDVVWINGRRVGGLELSWDKLRVYALGAGTLHAGENVVAVRVEDTGGGGGMYGPADAMYLDLGDKRRPLDGEWLFRVGAFRFDPNNNANQFPTLLYNKMIYPMLSYPIKGVLWYQGESNTGPDDAYKYRSLFVTMIEDWRRLWRVGDFPFLFVQLANYLAPVEEPSESNWAMVRESQSAALVLPKTAQAVIIDIGDADDVHPRDKQDVGLRLSLAARHVAYGEKDIVYSGPTYRDHEIRDGKVVLAFDHVGGGLVARGGDLREFAIAGADLHFVWAQAKIDGEKIVVWSDGVPEPVAVRYAWADNPDGANLYNSEGLPASPFRTDDW